MTKTTIDIEKYQYDYIFNLILDIFKFNEKKYGNFVKDVIRILLDYEKNGETIIDVDNSLIIVELFEDGWPNKHLDILKNIDLIGSFNSPFVLVDRKLSLAKWSRKIERVINSFLKKIDTDNLINSIIYEDDNKIDQIKNIFKYSNLVFLQGGPGTGKTTLIISLILEFLRIDNFLNIGLSSPTGKATARLKEALNDKKNISFSKFLDQIEFQTLHRWILNSQNKSLKLKFKLNQLDIFIIDEMSMVNIDLIESVLSLLAKDCKIILVGDKNQLSPVNNCSIWNYLFEYCENSSIKSCVVNLEKTYRNFGDIALISNLIFNNDYSLVNQKIKELAKNNKSKEVNFLKSIDKDIPKHLFFSIKSHLNKLNLSTSNLSKKKYIFDEGIDNLLLHEKDLVDKIFLDLQSHLILCEKNSGIWSVEYLNEIVFGQKKPYDLKTLKEGVPIMCTKNNNELGLSNGDIGVLIGLKNERKYLFRKFNDNNEEIVELIDPYNLENVVPAIAITIHKSQGSESDKVSILWSQKYRRNQYALKEKKDSENMFWRDNFEKRLFYTAVTRAKKFLNIYYLN
ncbi:Exodeoxyribonuclease V alpha chain [Prochlorococcus marinus str. MIT 9321]|uniref:Exodeoxyribonuclease V alpha chain n=1 Tax=Prochlorococcus marinus str. MIT 9401 TaxID=167551 RepID=A0A0A2BAT5_PROMR|nr:AAA family ATPase [Prochlorococcus marinus]KGG05882.1 Exodeoxyribonuclease V alpha chain [Prochlorococcus marinus str. MIT 9322]KGG05951.1 Exodeoxyribonuclease V alpha chain [Prochlorococcus marinus str. MIT 9321]KGG10981.1 Exodeoxyribonuclease V alpha chain [Prochlorococcus marinus str. MIT 9401]